MKTYPIKFLPRLTLKTKVASLLFLLSFSLWAQDDLDSMIEDLFVPEEQVGLVNEDSELGPEEDEEASFGGAIRSELYWLLSEEQLKGEAALSNSTVSPTASADFFLDIRLAELHKAFISASVYLLPDGIEIPTVYEGASNSFTNISEQNLLLQFNEFFIDLPMGDRLFNRVGKQVLKWGQGYFWNPADLVNVEAKDFSDLEALREGNYGLRMHYVRGASFNAYGFFRADHYSDYNSYSAALRVQQVFGGTEMAIGSFQKPGRHGVLSLDLSTGLGVYNVYFEGIAAKASIKSYWTGDNNNPVLEERLENGAKLVLGMNRSWKDDQLYGGLELYYNSWAYTESEIERYSELLKLYGYESLKLGKAYAAFFFTYSGLKSETMSTGLNAALNLESGDAVFVPSWSYNPAGGVRHYFNVQASVGDNESDLSSTALSLNYGVEYQF